MASQSLYRKWRSQTFGDLVGQEPVIRTLKNALTSDSLAHAYLFTGPRGTGKTSTARLLAKTINCLYPQNGEPCNECEQCLEITAGNSFNVIEIDAASNRGIDSIRELREKVMVPPSTGKYKVYILDEAHMLTVEAFNALLKTLEEPPAHAVFVMATTDVHKMLPTVLSRCQRFDFKRITTRCIIEHLEFIAQQEHIELERGAAELIARAAAGGMRDALSLLDQAIAYSGQHIALAQVQAMLGVADPRAIQKFVLHISQLDSSAGLHLIHKLTESGADLRQINTQVAEYFRAMMLKRAGADIGAILDSSDSEIQEISQAAQLFTLDELVECARVFAQNDLIQKNLGTPQLGLELALLKCIEVHRHAQAGQTPGPPAHAPVRATSRDGASGAAQHARKEAPTMSSLPGEQTPSTSTDAEILRDVSPPLPISETVSISFVEQQKEVSTAVEVSLPEEASSPLAPGPTEGYAVPSLTVQDVKERWEYIKKRIRTRKDGPKIAAFLNGYTIVSVGVAEGVPIVYIKANAQFHYSSMQTKSEYRESIEWAMKVELKQDCQVCLLSPTAQPPAETLSAARFSSPGAPATNSQSSEVRVQSLHEPSAVLPPRADSNGTSSVQTDMPRNGLPAVAVAERDPVLLEAKSELLQVQTQTTMHAPNEQLHSLDETRQERARREAMNHPVVKRAIEMFKAEIKDIHLK